MKKLAVLTFVLTLLAPSIFAAPTDEEVMASFSGVFGVYGAIFLTSHIPHIPLLWKRV